MKPAYEELEAKLQNAEAKIQRLEELLKLALEKIAKLEEQLNRNSKNSSKPPSTDQKGNTDKTGKNPPRSSRKGKARSPLTGVLHVAKREAMQLIKDLYGVDMGVGSLPNVEERVSAALDPVYDRIHKFIMEHKFCTHFNETGWRDNGKRHFVWLATCQQAAVYRINRNRSLAAFQRLIGQETWKAPAVTDRYAVYGSFKNHQYCLAHLIREFKGHGEREGPDKAIGLAIENELRLSCKIHGEYR